MASVMSFCVRSRGVLFQLQRCQRFFAARSSDREQSPAQTGTGASWPASKNQEQSTPTPMSVSEKVSMRMRKLKKKSETQVSSSKSSSSDDQFTLYHTEEVPYRYRLPSEQELQKAPQQKSDEGGREGDPNQQKQFHQYTYTDYTGFRFPTLNTAEHFDPLAPRGMDRVMERAFPIKVPGYRRLDPYLREYIHFLHKLDPARFTIERIAERYRLRPKTVAKVVQEWGTNLYLTRSGLTQLREKQVTREAEVLRHKEQMYGKWVGFDQLGDQDDDVPSDDEETQGEFKGWRNHQDWVRKQTVQVEMMSAFPMMGLRNPMPKKVDIDLCVDSQQHHKVINWIDPTEKVVF